MDKFGYPKHTVEEVTEFVGNGIRNLIERSVPGGAEDENFAQVFNAVSYTHLDVYKRQPVFRPNQQQLRFIIDITNYN